MEEKILELVEHTLLYDFYGELLTEHQRHIYEMVVFEDCSVSEVAREVGISRQGVHDMIKRCNRMLQGYERQLGMVERFQKIRHQVQTLQSAVREDPEIPADVAEKLVTRLEAVMEEM
ncbi:MAG: sigma factor-like helix-turn-helix DNA-binding protein [Lachnospiraceae bacterium]|nr:sigma factor-like helix-turn-helix DNA-binding protein [Lachnospiraceae bacterium]MDY5741999.1 sigma factor-like helix-turn-helix DNA-binding protein [Lachnospiraceae bacterium]